MIINSAARLKPRVNFVTCRYVGFRHLLTFACALALTISPAQGSELHKLWEFNAGKLIEMAGDAAGQLSLTQAVRFSPDGRSIAIAGPWRNSSYLAVVDAQKPKDTNVLFADILHSPPTGHLAWASSGQQLVSGSTFVRLLDKKSCSGPGILYLVGEDKLLVQTSPRRLTLLDSDCRPTGTLNIPEKMVFEDASEKGLISFRQIDSRNVSIVEAQNQKLIRQLPSWEYGRFPNGDDVICGKVNKQPREALICLNLDSGKELLTFNQPILASIEIRPARRAGRAIVSESSGSVDLDFRHGNGSLRRRSLWDLDKRKELVSWQPKTQEYHYGATARKVHHEPDPFDLSPDGTLIVEAHAGLLSLYQLVP